MALSTDEIKQELAGLDDWAVSGKEIRKTFKTEDFTHSMDLVMRIGELADEQGHHPDIDIRYDKVTIILTTHSDGGVTENDIRLAKAIEDLE